MWPALRSTLPDENVVGNLTWTISPRMVNEAEFAYTQGTISSDFEAGSDCQLANSVQANSRTTLHTTILMAVSRIFHLPARQHNMAATSGSTPYFERNLDRTLFDNFSVTLGRHTVRAGATISKMLKTENAGSGAANFLVHQLPGFSSGQCLQAIRRPAATPFPICTTSTLKRTGRMTGSSPDRLTLNLGVRYSYFPSPADVLNTLNNFDPLLFEPDKAPAIDPVSGNFTAPADRFRRRM